MISPETLGIGLGYFEFVLGLAFLVWALRANAFHRDPAAGRLATRSLAPLGLIFMINGALRVLKGVVPTPLLITAAVIAAAAAVVWTIRLR